MPETISIIIPLYNRKNTFLLSLASLYAQTYQALELIIVDDGSTQFNIFETELRTHPRIHAVKIRQEHKGAQAARNTGFKKSSGDFVLFWDADIIAKPSFVAELHATLIKHPKAGYAYSNFYWGMKKMRSRMFDASALTQQNYIHMSSLMRRDVCIPFDETIQKFQDWDIWLSLLERGVCGVWVDDFLYKIVPGGFISTWMPKCFYGNPWKSIPGIRGIVKKYEVGKGVIQKKHETV